MVVPTLALGWLALEFDRRDRQLERDRARERAAHAATQVVAASQARLVELESHLQAAIAGGEELRAGVRLVTVQGNQLDAKPAGALVFRPVLPARASLPSRRSPRPTDSSTSWAIQWLLSPRFSR